MNNWICACSIVILVFIFIVAWEIAKTKSKITPFGARQQFAITVHTSVSIRKYKPFPLLSYFSAVVCLRWLYHHMLSVSHAHTHTRIYIYIYMYIYIYIYIYTSYNTFMGPPWDPPGSCRPQVGPMLAPWTLLSGILPFALHLDMLFPSQITQYENIKPNAGDGIRLFSYSIL